MDEISATLGIKPTKVIRQGDVLNRLPQIVAGEDEWIYAQELESPQGRDEIMRGILQNIGKSKSGLEKVIAKCCQPSAADRFQSAAELMYALDHVHDEDNEICISSAKLQ